jgi:hypothetical protein
MPGECLSEKQSSGQTISTQQFRAEILLHCENNPLYLNSRRIAGLWHKPCNGNAFGLNGGFCEMAQIPGAVAAVMALKSFCL